VSERQEVTVDGLRYVCTDGEWFAHPEGASWRITQDNDKSRLLNRIVALAEEKRHNVACVKWIANAFCDEHGNPRADMPLWAHAVTDTLLIGLTPADAVIAQMKMEARAETRQPVAWWIGPHDGLLAGATANKSLADARIEHGATVRPLVFGDVAAEAKAVIEAAEYVCDDYDEAEVNSLPTPMRHLWNAVAALYAAKAGGASDGR